MSIRHSPPSNTVNSGSFPNLSILKDDDFMPVTVRKRKVPDGENISMKDIRHEISDALNEHRQELKDTLLEFQKQITLSFERLLDKQNECITKLHEDICNIKSDIVELKKNHHANEKIQTELRENISKFSSLYENLKDKCMVLEHELNDAKQRISDTTEQYRSLDQRGRMKNLEISGVPQIKGENLNSVMYKIATKIGFGLSTMDIDQIHRVRRFVNPIDQRKSLTNYTLPSPPPNIIVKFTQYKRKNEFLAAVRARRGLTTADIELEGAAKPIFINDHLSPHNKIIYGRVRKLGKELGYRYIWLNDCKIFIRKNDSSKAILISSEKDLEKIK